MAKSEWRYWVVYGNEEKPLGIAFAKTPGGAKKKYEDRTHQTRDGIYVEELEFKKGYFSFISSI